MHTLSRSDLAAATAGIGNPAITLCLESVDDEHQGPTQDRHKSHTTPFIISSTVELLSSLQAAISEGVQVDSSTRFDGNVRTDGILLENAYQFVSLSDGTNEERYTVLALCSLPIRPEKADRGKFASLFCRKAVDTLVRFGSNDDVLAQAVLERVGLCSTMLGAAFDEEAIVLQRVCFCRMDCCRNKTIRDVWYHCVSQLVRHSDDTIELVRIARRLVACGI